MANFRKLIEWFPLSKRIHSGFKFVQSTPSKLRDTAKEITSRKWWESGGRAKRLALSAVDGVVAGHHLWKNSRPITRIAIATAVSPIFAVSSYWLIGQFSGTVNNTELIVNPPKSGSYIVETTARSMQRELEANGWCPSGGPLSFVSIRYDICGFQEGVQHATVRIAQELQTHLTREGPNSKEDPDMNAALNALNRDNKWSFFLANSTHDQYEKSVADMDRLNGRIVKGNGHIYPRIDTLNTMLGTLSGIVGGETNRLKESADTNGILSMQAREDYFHGLGVLATVCWDLRAVNIDFKQVISYQSTTDNFERAATSACESLNVHPHSVINGRAYGILPADLRVLRGAAANTLTHLLSAQISLAGAPTR